MANDLETLTRSYWIAEQRVRRMPIPELDTLAVLADLEATDRRERAAIPRILEPDRLTG